MRLIRPTEKCVDRHRRFLGTRTYFLFLFFLTLSSFGSPSCMVTDPYIRLFAEFEEINEEKKIRKSLDIKV